MERDMIEEIVGVKRGSKIGYAKIEVKPFMVDRWPNYPGVVLELQCTVNQTPYFSRQVFELSDLITPFDIIFDEMKSKLKEHIREEINRLGPNSKNNSG